MVKKHTEKNITDQDSLKIKPYARLLTMLGEQLIKNERIALIELIKNSYDADANWVRVGFENFGNDWAIEENSKIIIEDDGIGMTEEVVRHHFTNPATPEKKVRKKRQPRTDKGRYLQGEKGIGRFAMLKLGRKITIATRTARKNKEFVIGYDFSQFDDEFLSINGKEKNIFLDELEVKVKERNAETIVSKNIKLGTRLVKRKPQGTRIEISNLKGAWTARKVEGVYNDVARLQSIFISNEQNIANSDNFEVYVYQDAQQVEYEDHSQKLARYIENSAVLKYVDGEFDQKTGILSYKLNDRDRSLSFEDASTKGNKSAKKHFQINDSPVEFRKPQCGNFSFGFYVFDFNAKPGNKYHLNKDEKVVIRAHRIYLYRDGVRVYPYGEPDDDWLGIDMHRGTVSAGDYVSNDQIVGYVNISHEQNPDLVDKTNREGLIENGLALDDFKAILKTLLQHIRLKDFKQYQIQQNAKSGPAQIEAKELIEKDISLLKNLISVEKDFDSSKATEAIVRLENNYKSEKGYLVKRAEMTEELAGVGLSVETTSHDIVSMIQKTENRLDALIKDSIYADIDPEALSEELQVLRGQISFISSQMNNMQSLFKSSKQRRKDIRVLEVIDKVSKIYTRIFKEKKITLDIEAIGSPLIAKTTNAVLLQVLINLFDNAIYWLDTVNRKEGRKIKIRLNGSDGVLIFSDNGPGIDNSDKDYLFEAFYSGKGEEGRGLGLYIAKQLLQRHEYDIELASLKSDHLLSGANFLVNFIKG